MMLRSLFIGIALWAATTVAAYAGIYTWTDDQGTVHFTEDAEAVPPEFRNNVRSDDESSVPPAETAPTPPAGEKETNLPPSVNERDATATELFGSKSRDQWQQELEQSEAAMVAVRNRLEEIAARVGENPANTAEHNKLVIDHLTLQAQYKEMKAGYFRLVEAARKAGIQVILQK